MAFECATSDKYLIINIQLQLQYRSLTDIADELSLARCAIDQDSPNFEENNEPIAWLDICLN